MIPLCPTILSVHAKIFYTGIMSLQSALPGCTSREMMERSSNDMITANTGFDAEILVILVMRKLVACDELYY